jgi:hypothetical protein
MSDTAPEKVKKARRKRRRNDAIGHDNPEELAACGDHDQAKQ